MNKYPSSSRYPRSPVFNQPLIMVFFVSSSFFRYPIVFEGDLNRGEHTFPLSHNQGGKISSGQYFYRIGISGGQALSKSFVVR